MTVSLLRKSGGANSDGGNQRDGFQDLDGRRKPIQTEKNWQEEFKFSGRSAGDTPKNVKIRRFCRNFPGFTLHETRSVMDERTGFW